MLAHYETDRVHPFIGERFALADAPAALGALKTVGEIVLAPSLDRLSY